MFRIHWRALSLLHCSADGVWLAWFSLRCGCKVKNNWKPVLVFGEPKGWISGDVIEWKDSGRKRHEFEQSEEGTIRLVEMQGAGLARV